MYFYTHIDVYMYNITNGGVEGEENFVILSYCVIYVNRVYLFTE